MLKTLLSLLGGCALATACGSSGSSSPAAPSSTSSGSSTTTSASPTTLTAAQTATVGVFTITFPVGTQTSDVDLIKNAAAAHSSYFQSAFGRTITQASQIVGSTTDPGCADPGASAFTGFQKTTICITNNPGWLGHNTLNRQKILAHELFLMLGYEMRWLGHPGNQDNFSAHWIDEGSAEFAAWKAVSAEGLLTYSAAKSCNIAQANAQLPATVNLSTMETGQGFGRPGAFQVAMLGMDQLTTNPGMGSLMTYGTAIAAGTSWPTAFQSAFGTSTTDFYNQWVAYRQSLGSGSDTCGS